MEFHGLWGREQHAESEKKTHKAQNFLVLSEKLKFMQASCYHCSDTVLLSWH